MNINVTREGPATGAIGSTPGQKPAFIKGVSDLLFEALGAPQMTLVLIDEVEPENWGVRGATVPSIARSPAQRKGELKWWAVVRDGRALFQIGGGGLIAAHCAFPRSWRAA
ncbi:tautomerase family protein [Bradyrhizobium sp. USDA 3256]